VIYIENNEWDTINAGFTQEWSLGRDFGESLSDWDKAHDRWFPIRHGDRLPIDPPLSNRHPDTVFYIRADLNGMKGSFGEIRISW
jgi:hypothetical protein